MLRRLRQGIAALLILASILPLASPAHAASDAELRSFAQHVGLADIAGFVEAVQMLDKQNVLPPRYLTKAQAGALHWRPGGNLCRVAPGRMIGGDVFSNRERRVPVRAGRRYHEADLDARCGDRGAHRLIYADDGARFVTVDHYRSFQPVPP